MNVPVQTMRFSILLGISILVCVGIWFFPPIPQDPTYHHFADQRILFGIPNCLDVISNLPILIAGLFGIRFLLTGNLVRRDGPFQSRQEYVFFFIFFIATCLISFGSSYYHLEPSNNTLVWDRIPITIVTMTFLTIIVGERLSDRLAKYLIVPLIVIGIFSVCYWHYTETIGRGDLRLYALVHFYPLLGISLMLALFPPRYTCVSDLIIAFGWFIVSKICEFWDKPIFEFTGFISGHTLKHLTSALALYWIYRYITRRRSYPSIST